MPLADADTTCSVCGRDEIQLRYASYPVIPGLFLNPVRYDSSDLLCRKHRTIRWVYASIITILFGWMGGSWSKVPSALTVLAKGGSKDKKLNHDLMVRLANKRLENQDAYAELHCLEESYCLYADDDIESRLLRLYSRNTGFGGASHGESLTTVIYYLGLPIGAWLLGVLVGLGAILPLLLAQMIFGVLPAFSIVYSVIQFTVTTFWSMSVVTCSIEKLLRLARSSNKSVNLLLACISPVLLFCGILTMVLLWENSGEFMPAPFAYGLVFAFMISTGIYSAVSLVNEVLVGNSKLFLLRARIKNSR